MSTHPPSRHKHYVLQGMLIVLGLIILLIGAGLLVVSSHLGEQLVPPTLEPGETAATARARETHVAAAKTQTPGLVKETGVITLPFSQPTTWGDGPHVYFDGVKLWVSLGHQLIAFEPEVREVVFGPIELKDHAVGMAFDGQRLWVSDIWSLFPIDVGSGEVGTAMLIGVAPYSMVYDGARLWIDALENKHSSPQSIDPISREVFPPVETGLDYPLLIPDISRHVLWLVDFSGKVQSYDLQQKVLRDTSFRFDQVRVGPTRDPAFFDGQRLWAIRTGKPEHESVGQALDVDTGKVTQLPDSLTGIISSEFDGRRIWLGNEDWTVQPFDTVTGQLGAPIPIYGYPGDLAFDGKRLWIALYDNSDNSASSDGRHFVGLQYLVPQED
jgi:hypothetical protein